jgi:hypothetical protein
VSSKVPDPEIIEHVLNAHFNETEVGGWASEDESGAIYIYRADGNLYAYLSPDTWFELLNFKEEEETK